MGYLENIMNKDELLQFSEEELSLEDFLGLEDEYEPSNEEIQRDIEFWESHTPKHEIFTEETHKDNMIKIQFLMKQFVSKDSLEMFDLDIEKQISKLIDNNDEKFLILLSIMADGINKELNRQYSVNKRLEMVISNLIKIIKTVDLDNNILQQ